MASIDLDPLELPAAHAILRILEAEGVEYVFGVPGGPLTGFFEALQQRQRIRFVLAKHECGAAFMAATYARVSGKLAVCCVTSGPGATNALTGIAGAYADGVPLLLLTGQVATHVFGKGAIQESSVFGTDLVELLRPVTLASTMFPAVGRIPDLVRGAIRTAMTGRRGPVHLSMPADMLARPVRLNELSAPQYRATGAPFDPQAVEAAAQALWKAKRPCILAGNGVALAGASQELLALAGSQQIPVATSPKGKGTFPEQHELSLGVLGFGGHDLAERYVEAAGVDALLVVGSSLNEFVTNGFSFTLGRAPLLHLDVDPRAIGRNYPVTIAMIGDARASLAALHERLEQLGPPPEREREPLAALRTTTPRYLAAEALESDARPLKPQRVMRELSRALPEDALLFVDNGTSIIWATHYFEARRPNGYFIDLGLASMGSAVAGVVGGALAAPGRRAVALVGDAAFAMNGMEVHTAAEYRLPVVWLVLNNGGHGMVQQGETIMKGASFGTSQFRSALDIAALGRSLGAEGVSVDAPLQLRAALERALAADGPTVIDIKIDAQEIAPTLIRRAQTLADFMALSRLTDPPTSLKPPTSPPLR